MNMFNAKKYFRIDINICFCTDCIQQNDVSMFLDKFDHIPNELLCKRNESQIVYIFFPLSK